MNGSRVQRRLMQLDREKAAMIMGMGMERPRRRTVKKKVVSKRKTVGSGSKTMRAPRSLKSPVKKKRTTVGKKSTNPWIKHVKKYASTHGLTYGEALKKAGKTYRG